MNIVMVGWALLPLLVFILLFRLEKGRPGNCPFQKLSPGDWLISLSGFWMQGVVIPVVGFSFSSFVLSSWLPGWKGFFSLGFTGAFLLNVIVVDFLYYWQHRAFHQVPWLWRLHASHHYSPVVNIWATSRNALVTHFLFVYMLLNPILGYLCDSPEGFFAGAMVTAALDILRHANIQCGKTPFDGILVLPGDHHRHHDERQSFCNYAANFMIWDRLFGTAYREGHRPGFSQPYNPPSIQIQLLYPWKASK